MQKHFKSHFCGANVPHLPEWYSFDTMFYDVPTLDDGIPSRGGCTMIQMFGELDSKLLHSVPMKMKVKSLIPFWASFIIMVPWKALCLTMPSPKHHLLFGTFFDCIL